MIETSSQPNIVLILTDHFRRDAVGASTPNLERLARRGTRFSNAYCASPLCQPSRTSLATGLYPSQNGVCGNMADPLPDRFRDDTFMHHLQRAGYQTAMIGKHHLIDAFGLSVDVRDNDAELRRFGFDQVFQVIDAGENLQNDDEYTNYLRDRGVLDDYRRIQKENAASCGAYPFPEDDSEDGLIGRTACQFVETYADDRPFYLNVSFVGPHPPYWHPGALQHDPAAMPKPLGAEDQPRTRERRAHYMEKCALIDRYVGRLVGALEATSRLDQTLIIFTSDHGDMLGDFGVWDKRVFYEASVGVPLIMAGPGVPAGVRNLPGKTSKVLVSLLDVYPTVLDAAHVAMPSHTPKRAGRSIFTTLNEDAPARRDELFAELATAVMIRTANWKLVFDPEQGGVCQLFNLTRDGAEEHNLAGVPGYEHTTNDLLARILAHRIRLAQYTQEKEEQRLQRVRTG